MAFKTKSKTNKNSQTDVARIVRPKKTCLFCDNKTEPTYTDVVTLKKFISDRSKIYSKSRSGMCSKHQRRIAQEIKRARHLSLMTFVARV